MNRPKRKPNDSHISEMLVTFILGCLAAVILPRDIGYTAVSMAALILMFQFLSYLDDNEPVKERKPVVAKLTDTEGLRMFEFNRGVNKEFSVTVVVKNGVINCYTNQQLPSGCPEDVALAFFQDADVAVEKTLAREAAGVKS